MIPAPSYDANGNMTRRAVGGLTTCYIGSYDEYEVGDSDDQRYYYHAGKRVAMRLPAGGIRWLLSDHLGSTTVTVRNDTLLPIAEIRYRAYGKALPGPYTSGATPTTYHF